MTTVADLLMEKGSLSREQEQKLLAIPTIGAIATAIRTISLAAANVPFVADLGAQIQQAFDRPLADGLIGAWTTFKEVREYADPSKHPPDEQSTYALAEHTAKSSYKSNLDLIVDGTKRWTIELEAEVALEIQAGNLLIRAGRIWALRLGQVTGSGTLRVEGTDVVRRESEPVSLPGEIRFEKGIPIPA